MCKWSKVQEIQCAQKHISIFDFELLFTETVVGLDQGSPNSRGPRAAQPTTGSLAGRIPLLPDPTKRKQQTQNYENNG